MKTILSVLLIFSFSVLKAQNVYPTPKFCFVVYTPPSFTFNFHRPKKDCKSGLGICLRYHLGDYRFVPCNNLQERQGGVSLEKDLVTYLIYLDENHAYFHLPAGLKNYPGFEGGDISTFYIDGDDFLLGNPEEGVAFRLKEGAYPVEESDGHWVAAVDTESVDIQLLQ